MTEFIEFCREYGVYLLTFACFVVEIIFIFIKRKPKTIDDFLFCLNEIRVFVPDLIKQVETPGNGDVKKATVIKVCGELLEKKLGRKITEKECAVLSNLVGQDIEAVLSTPKKKEISNEK